MREFMKKQQRLDAESMIASSKSNVLSTIRQKIWSSQGNLSKSTKDLSTCSGGGGGGTINSSSKFSELVGAGGSVSGSIACRSSGTVQKKHKVRSRSKTCDSFDSAFKIGEIENDGRRTVTSLMGVQRDSEVLYVGNFNSADDGNNGKRGKIDDVFEMAGGNSDDNETDTNRSGYGTLSRSFSQHSTGCSLVGVGGAAGSTTTQKLHEINEEIARWIGVD